MRWYHRIHEYKIAGKTKDAIKLHDELYIAYDQSYRHDLLLMIRDIVKEKLYEKKKIDNDYEQAMNLISAGAVGMLSTFKNSMIGSKGHSVL